MYDYLIVGAGLAGSIIARELTNSGYDCVVIDRRDHIGGNCATENIEGINIHKYGPHIFHTSNETVKKYITNNTKTKEYRHRSIAKIGKKLYELPINLMTLNSIYGLDTPELASKVNLKKVREIIFDGYCQKQWGKSFYEVPSQVIDRIPIRSNCDDNYFSDSYQCMPDYEYLFTGLLYGIKVLLNVDYSKCDIGYKKLIYTGSLDDLYQYRFGKLEYRCCNWKLERHDIPYYQGCAIVSYPDKKVTWTRIIEHKYFENIKCDFTYTSKEFSSNCGDPSYPIENNENIERHNRYKNSAEKDGVIYCGRLAEYKYLDMDKVVLSALKVSSRILENE
jgi:UDP-galactopyranose mutase